MLRENKRPPEAGLCNRRLARRQLRSYERLTLIPHSALHYYSYRRIDCSALGSNACFEAALAIGILSDGILIGGSRTSLFKG